MQNLDQHEFLPPAAPKKNKLPWLLSGLVLGALLICGIFAAIVAANIPKLLPKASSAPEHGVKVIFQAQTGNGEKPSATDLQKCVETLTERAIFFGIQSYSFRVSGTEHITALLPKDDSSTRLLENITHVGLVEFVDMGDRYAEEGTEIVTDFAPSPQSSANAAIQHTILSGENIKSAGVTTNQINNYVVAIEFDDKGKTILKNFSQANVGKYLAITLDKKILTEPKIQTAILDGSAIIESDFNKESAEELAIFLQTRALPFALTRIETTEY